MLRRRKLDIEGLVEQMLAWIPPGSVEVQLGLKGVIRAIALRDILVSRLSPIPGRIIRIPLVRPVEEGPAFVTVDLYEIHLSRAEKPRWQLRTVARKFGGVILLLARFEEVERLRQRNSQQDRRQIRELLRTFAKRWLARGRNRDELAQLLQRLVEKRPEELPEITLG